MNTRTLDMLVSFKALAQSTNLGASGDLFSTEKAMKNDSAWTGVQHTLSLSESSGKLHACIQEGMKAYKDTILIGGAKWDKPENVVQSYMEEILGYAECYGVILPVEWKSPFYNKLLSLEYNIPNGWGIIDDKDLERELKDAGAIPYSYRPSLEEFNRELMQATESETTTKEEEVKMTVKSDMFVGDKKICNDLLSAVSDGKLSVEIISDLAERAESVGALEDKIKVLERYAASRPKTALPESFKGVSSTDLKGELTWQKASVVFNLTSKAQKEMMSFDVPVWSWANAGGELCNHPEVPVVDDFYKFDSRLFDALRAVMNRDFMWIWGHTGAGKSSLIEQIAARLNFPLVTVSMDGEITRMDLIGQTKLTEKKGVTVTEFVEGVLPNAMSRPSILLMDEMDFVRGDVAYALQTVLNSKSGTLNLLEDGGRVVQRHPWSMICATANTNGRGDESGKYNYAKRQSGALLNRFTTWMKVDYLKRADELVLLKRIAPQLTDKEAEELCNYAKEHRAAFLKDDIEMAMSLRNLTALAEKYIDYKEFYGDETNAMKQAFKNTITNAASEDDAIAINGIRQRVIGA